LRWLIGRLRIFVSPIVFATSVEAGSMSPACPRTVTASATPATRSPKSTLAEEPIVTRTSESSPGWNPVIVAVTR
jgi:hypothetical protein